MRSVILPVIIAALLSVVGWTILEAMSSREIRGAFDERVTAMDDRMTRQEERLENQLTHVEERLSRQDHRVTEAIGFHASVIQRLSDRITILEREYAGPEDQAD